MATTMFRVLQSKQPAKPTNILDYLPDSLQFLRHDKYWRYVRLALEILLEVVLVVVFLKVYNWVRNQFGSQRCPPEVALRHALQVIHLEQSLGFYWEEAIQRVFVAWTAWIRAWNFFYGSAHMAVTIFVLGFLFALRPAAYQRCRTVFMLMNMLALIGYASYPLMPPRLVPDCDDPYGGCHKEYSFVDTMDKIGGLWSWRHSKIAKVSNHYAAMPSMHAGYSIWCATSMYSHSPYMLFKVLALIYPWLTLYCIVVTANHYFLDAVFGALAWLIATKVAPYIPQCGRGADSSSATWSGSSSEEDESAALLPVTASDLLPGKRAKGAAVAVVTAEPLHSIALGSFKDR